MSLLSLQSQTDVATAGAANVPGSTRGNRA
jgi:hypothetical protein